MRHVHAVIEISGFTSLVFLIIVSGSGTRERHSVHPGFHLHGGGLLGLSRSSLPHQRRRTFSRQRNLGNAIVSGVFFQFLKCFFSLAVVDGHGARQSHSGDGQLVLQLSHLFELVSRLQAQGESVIEKAHPTWMAAIEDVSWSPR